MNLLYPIALLLEGRPCVVVGGGKVAEQKVKPLLDSGAQVTVISPHLTQRLQQWVDAGQVRHLCRPYRRGDLAGAFLIYGCTDDAAVNRQVFEEANARGQLCNIVDVPELCNFYAQSIVRRGNLLLTIGTHGISPTLAKWLREQLEESIGPEYVEFLEIAATLRPEAKRKLATPADRQKAWRRVVESDVFDLLRRGERQKAEDRMKEILTG
ncbi:MAG: bifunctional precorrin-2 dehydrogenase/sirohydrochlorin ferrochelatase [Abditibacteriales bacterium]|nr:bifunctional precorrin-2 dehydrogenase/sirohydrochlorin ferrochelatase [Abditibacteriales bacterium]MDW8366908.1 bifunctional precorrin-2 dehydrogenase/sirohydrochlorin ferrochelatase [Abditibacteriales bacterium]